MKTASIWAAALLMAACASAQTLKIFHKSHAGMPASFTTDVVDHFGGSYQHLFINDSLQWFMNSPLLHVEPLPVPPLIPVPDFKATVLPIIEPEQAPDAKRNDKEPAKPKPAKPKGQPAEGGGPNEGQHLKEIPCPEDSQKTSMSAEETRGGLPWGMVGLVSIPLLVVASGAIRQKDRSKE